MVESAPALPSFVDRTGEERRRKIKISADSRQRGVCRGHCAVEISVSSRIYLPIYVFLHVALFLYRSPSLYVLFESVSLYAYRSVFVSLSRRSCQQRPLAYISFLGVQEHRLDICFSKERFCPEVFLLYEERRSSSRSSLYLHRCTNTRSVGCMYT